LNFQTRIPLGRAYILASTISREIRRAGLTFDELTPVGGIRRFAPDVGDVALIGVAPAARHPHLLKALSRLAIPGGSVTTAAGQATVTTDRGSVTVYLRAPEQAGAALLWHTGSRGHLALLQRLALDRGLLFDAGELIRHGQPMVAESETDVYQALGLPFIAPELRQGLDEIEAALEGRLPNLIGDVHIRGDLHMHTTWSDGRDPVADMVGAGKQLGYEYVAITDHSQRAMSSRKLAIEDIDKQRAEVDALRARTSGIQVLHGVEVDIMPDGSLDFDDAVLERFDIVLASLHDHAGHDSATLTERCLSAIRHPLVNIITHPANRSPAASPGYDLDFDRVFAAAVDTGTALEVDGAPGHLDLDGELARRAVGAGVTLTIDSDAHRAEWLARQMRFGVGTARRGWVEPRHVLNTRSIDDVRAFVARKRARA
jgi:DNA polymerase (family X)